MKMDIGDMIQEMMRQNLRFFKNKFDKFQISGMVQNTYEIKF
jgi:hypothetical protein